MKHIFKYSLLVVFTLSNILTCFSNDSTNMSFNSTSIELDLIYEADGMLPVAFTWENTGVNPIKINRVIAPGFKKISYTNDSVMPGNTGIIKALIDPFGSTGLFHKQLTVFSNTGNSPQTLTVTGKIINGTAKSAFKYNIGGVIFKHNQLNFGYIFNGEIVTKFVHVKNGSNKTMKITYDHNSPYISLSNNFDSLQADETGLIEVTFNTKVIDDWDFIISKVNLSINSKSISEKPLIVTANIRENFTSLSAEEKSNLPRAYLPIKVFNFDTIAVGSSIYYEFPVFNKGTRDLLIRSVKPTCGCTAALPEKSVISPGDSTFIHVEFNSDGFMGLNKKGVTVITNDPNNYKEFLWITGYVE